MKVYIENFNHVITDYYHLRKYITEYVMTNPRKVFSFNVQVEK